MTDEDMATGIIEHIGEGYGVEDIALALEIPADEVRAYIRDLRAAGLIDEIFRAARETA